MASSASNTSDLRRDVQQGAREAANDLAGKAADLADKATKQLGYLVEYTDADGEAQSRWFPEEHLELVEAAPSEGN